MLFNISMKDINSGTGYHSEGPRQAQAVGQGGHYEIQYVQGVAPGLWQPLPSIKAWRQKD